MSHARLLVWMPLGTGSAWILQMIKNGYPRLLLSTSRSQSHCSPCSYPHHTELPRQHPGGTRRWWQHRKLFAPLLIDTHRVSPRTKIAASGPTKHPCQYAERPAQELEAKIAELGAKTVRHHCRDGRRRALRQSSSRGRCARPRTCPGHRAGPRSRQQGHLRPQAPARVRVWHAV